ncbi:D-amino-acid oxidase [Fusarium oxysporum f. sp. albedinis]|nr:D-amino-acid oxidase [Fusarium oxysporum f. sp. albedinis]
MTTRPLDFTKHILTFLFLSRGSATGSAAKTGVRQLLASGSSHSSTGLTLQSQPPVPFTSVSAMPVLGIPLYPRTVPSVPTPRHHSTRPHRTAPSLPLVTGAARRIISWDSPHTLSAHSEPLNSPLTLEFLLFTTNISLYCFVFPIIPSLHIYLLL